MLLVGLLALSMAGPALAAGNGVKATEPTAKTKSTDGDTVNTIPYYVPATWPKFYADEMQKRLDALPEDVRPKIEPEPSSVDQGKQPGFEASTSGSGAGPWTQLARAYDTNSQFSYGDYSQVMDSSSRRHLLFRLGINVDISQAPDAPGSHYAWLYNLYYTVYTEGTWSEPIPVTSTSGFENCVPVMFEKDDDGGLHLVYQKFSYLRRSSGGYSAANSNLFYRYMAPSGAWGDAVALTSYSGNYYFSNYDFKVVNNRVYGAWLATLDKDPVASWHSQYGFIDGAQGSWSTAAVLKEFDWDYSAASIQPDGWTIQLRASKTGGEVTCLYSLVREIGLTGYYANDIMSNTRTMDGAWQGETTLMSGIATNTNWSIRSFFYPPTENTATVMGYTYIQSSQQNVSLGPLENCFCYSRVNGSWQSTNVTNIPVKSKVLWTDSEVDSQGRVRLVVATSPTTWNTISHTWQTTGSDLEYAGQSSDGSWPAMDAVEPYTVGMSINSLSYATAQDNSPMLMYMKRLSSAPTLTGIYFSSKPVGATSFPGPVSLNDPSIVNMFNPLLTALPEGRVLATWTSRLQDVHGNLIIGSVVSRLFDGSNWGEATLASSVPNFVTNASYFALSSSELVCYFQTYDSSGNNNPRGYYVETVNGQWATPVLIGTSVTGMTLSADVNNRSFLNQSHWVMNQLTATPPASTYYLAEGTTRPGFAEWISIQNPNDVPAQVTITYMLETGEKKNQTISVPGHARSTVDVGGAVGPNHDVSAKVSGDRAIVVERPIYFNFGGGHDYNWTGGSDVVGVMNPSSAWYFAEGTTRPGFQEYLTLQNPANNDANVNVRYILDDGTVKDKTLSVQKHSRSTVDVNADVGPNRDVSMMVQSTGAAIVAERPMYFNYGGGHNYNWTGGHVAVGSTQLANRFYFAEGTTNPGFDTYMSVQNPTTTPADVTFTFMTGSGEVKTSKMNVPGNTRKTLSVNGAIGPNQDVSTKVDSTSPILVERPMYFNYQGKWTGGTDAVGTFTPKNSWFLAEGTTRNNFEEWLCIENPGDVATQVNFNYMLEDGSVVKKAITLAPHLRATVNVLATIGAGHDVSVQVWGDRGVIVERPMYFNYNGVWTGGHDAVGL